MKGQLILILLLITLKVTYCQDKHQLIVQGVLEGIKVGGEFDPIEIAQNLQNSEEFVSTLQHAIEFLQFQTTDTVKEGLFLIGWSIQQIPDSLPNTSADQDQSQALQKILTNVLEQLRSPSVFTYNKEQLHVNGVNLYDVIQNSVWLWSQNQYEEFGQQIGSALLQLLYQIENVQAIVIDEEVALQIFDGYLDGIVDASGIKGQDIRLCITGTSTMILNFEEAARLLETQELGNVVKSFQVFGDGLKEFPDALDKCKKTVKDAAKLAKQIRSLIKSLQSPISFAFHVGINLLVNGKDIYHEIFTAVDDWKTENYYDFGFQIGKASYQIFIGLEEMRQTKLVSKQQI